MYKYEEQKKDLLKNNFDYLIKTSIFIGKNEAFTANDVFNHIMGDSWTCLAAIDYLKENGYIREILQGGHVFAQDRKFVTIK